MSQESLGKLSNAVKSVTARKITLTLTAIANVLLTAISIIYICLTIASTAGIVLSIFGGLGSCVIMGMILYNTSMIDENESVSYSKEEIEKRETRATLFLILAIPSLFLFAFSNFVGTYGGIILLGFAISAAANPIAVSAVAIVISTVVALALLSYCLLQIFDMWEKIIKLKPNKNVNPNGSSTTDSNHSQESNPEVTPNALRASVTKVDQAIQTEDDATCYRPFIFSPIKSAQEEKTEMQKPQHRRHFSWT